MLASSIFRRPSAILQNRPDPRPLILISTSTDDEGSAKVTGGLVRDSASSPGNLIGVATVSPIDSERSWYPTPKKFASFAARRRRALKDNIGESDSASARIVKGGVCGRSDLRPACLPSSMLSPTTKDAELERLRAPEI